MAVTIREVAKAAGVSAGAVSKVLHGRGSSIRVSAERAKAIREIAAKLDYYPNALARGLRWSKTHTVGMIFENFGSITAGPLYFTYMLDGIAEGLFRQHYRLTILPELDDDDVLSMLGDGRLDGAIWCKMARDPRTLGLIRDCPIPIVALHAPAVEDMCKAVFVSCDNAEGVALGLRHLADLGHRKIVFVSEEGETSAPDAVARLAAFRIESVRMGLQPSEVCWSVSADQFEAWWASKPPETAVFAWNERIGAEVLDRAREAGAVVPRDLSVVAFDSTRFCDATVPKLTAVRQPIREMALHAATVLLSMLDGAPPESHSFVFPCGLDVRESTASIIQSVNGETL